MTDIVERARKCAEDFETLSPAAIILREAADTIERLRSICGKADVGPSFAEVTNDMNRRSSEYELPRPTDG